MDNYRAKAPVMAPLLPRVPLTEPERKLLQTLIYQECGMCFDERRASFLEDRLQRRLRTCRIDNFYGYYRLLTSQEGKRELAELLENLTINETSFFRNGPQLELFQKRILQQVLSRKQARREWTIRLWSAGCSTGQEPFTLAMLIAEALDLFSLRTSPVPPSASPKPVVPSPWRVELLASDISLPVLRAGQQGIYSEAQMEPVDYRYRLRYFDKIDANNYQVKETLRGLVQFDFHNLKTEFLPSRYDIIFCRNVMIYFDEAEQQRLVEKFYRCLNPEGFLFVGHAESLLGMTEQFRMIHEGHGTAYQRIESGA